MTYKCFANSKFNGLIAVLAMILCSSAASIQCITPGSHENLIGHDVETLALHATLDEASILTDIDFNQLLLATTTGPAFLVLLDDLAIPYSPRGPLTGGDLLSQSGLRIEPTDDSITITSPAGQVIRFSLSPWLEPGSERWSMPASTSDAEHGERWWFLMPTLSGAHGGASCWMASQMCWEQCLAEAHTLGKLGGACGCVPCEASPRLSGRSEIDPTQVLANR